MPYLLFLKKRQNFKLLSTANNIGGALWVNSYLASFFVVNSLHPGKLTLFGHLLIFFSS